jgi:hypothetical protein
MIAKVRFRWWPLAALVLASPEARADDRDAGLYGQLDSDFLLALGAGGGGFASADGAGGSGDVEARLRYLATASLVLGWDVRAAESPHAFVAAVELRPLFLALFFENRFTGDGLTDYVLYGLGLTGGISVSADGGAVVTGLGTEWPIARTRSSGLFVRTEARGRFSGGWPGGSDVTEVAALFLLQWHAPLHIVVVQ